MTVLFNYFLLRHTYIMMKDVGLARSSAAWGRLGWLLLGKPGLFRRMFLPWLAYFKPGLHPWEHDNRRKIAETEEALLDRPSAHASALHGHETPTA